MPDVIEAAIPDIVVKAEVEGREGWGRSTGVRFHGGGFQTSSATSQGRKGLAGYRGGSLQVPAATQ